MRWAPTAEEGPLTELEMSAIGEASNQMLASAAAAISVVIGQEIEISPPDVRILDAKLDAGESLGYRSLRLLHLVHDRGRALPPGPARAQRVRRADGARD